MPQETLAALLSAFVPEVLRVEIADPEYPDVDGSVGDNVTVAEKRLTDADSRLRDAGVAFRQGRILEAAEMLNEAERLQEEATRRLGEIELKRDQLARVTQENLERMKAVVGRNTTLVHEMDDHRTTEATRHRHGRLRIGLEEASRMISARPADPFRAEALLVELQQEADGLGAAIEHDRGNHAEAERSVQAAAVSVDRALRLANQAAQDAITDSAGIATARADLQTMSSSLEDIRSGLAEPHQNWIEIDRTADRIDRDAAKAAALLRGELRAVELALGAIAAASESIRQADGWSGDFGMRISGRPGSRWLHQARAMLQTGDYSGCMDAAQTARSRANTALARARAEVRQRRRREDERRAAEQRRRRAAAAALQRRNSSFGSSSGSGGSRSGFSPGSGTSRSSFSSGSGASRSGW